MKNRKGFTLIELLAIIVILAIIAVITVPIILNIIDNSKKGAAQDSAYGYKDAIEKYYATMLSQNNDFMINGEYSIGSNGSLTDGENTYDITVSGTVPSGGTLNITNGTAISGCIQINEYAVTIEDKKVTTTIKGSCTDTPHEQEVVIEEFPQVQDANPGIICGDNNTEDYDNNNTCYIYSVEDLVSFSNMVNSGKNFQGKTVLLMNNLDIQNNKSYANVNSNQFGDVNEDGTTSSTLKEELTTEKGFKTIGNDTNKFLGTFEGKAKTIKNLYINRNDTDYVGLFGYNEGTIRGLKITNSNVTGQNKVGLIVGRNNGNVTSVIATGNVSGNKFLGLATGLTVDGKVEAVVEGNVTSGSSSEPYPCAGGIAGYVENGTGRGINLGGAITTQGGVIYKNIGDKWNATLATISSNTVTANQEENNIDGRGGRTIPSSDIKNIAALEAVLDTYINGDKDKDNLSDGYYYDNDSDGNITIYSLSEKPLTITMAGTGTSADPYEITNYNELKEASYDVTKYYSLKTDIDLTNQNQIVLGSETNHFTGSFDGNGHKISNLSLKGYNYVGLFGYNEGIVKGLIIDNSTATGYKNIGLISGYNTGTITYTIAKGNVSGFQFLALATGRTEDGGTIESIVEGNVTSSNEGNSYAYAAGIAGCVQNSVIKGANLGGTISATVGLAYGNFGDSWNATKTTIASNTVVAPYTSEGLNSNSGKIYSPADLLGTAPYEEAGLNFTISDSSQKEYRYAFDSNNNIYIVKN